MTDRRKVNNNEAQYVFKDDIIVSVKSNEGHIQFTKHINKDKINSAFSIPKEILIAMFLEAKLLARGETLGKKRG